MERGVGAGGDLEKQAQMAPGLAALVGLIGVEMEVEVEYSPNP